MSGTDFFVLFIPVISIGFAVGILAFIRSRGRTGFAHAAPTPVAAGLSSTSLPWTEPAVAKSVPKAAKRR